MNNPSRTPADAAAARRASRRTAGGSPDNSYVTMARADARRYERARHLPALVALWPRELADTSRAGTAAIIEKLEKALRLERKRGRDRHWAYDLNRHMGLISALKAEREHLSALRATAPQLATKSFSLA